MTLARRIITVGTGTALAQVITAASTPLLTRVFAPEAHAAWAIFLSISVIFSGLAALRYDLAVVLPTDRPLAAAIALGGLASAGVVSLLAGASLWFGGRHLLAAEMQTHLVLWCWLVPVSIFSTALYQLAIAWCTREAAFKTYALAQFAMPVGILTLQLLVAVGGRRDSLGLIGGTVCGQLAVSLALGFTLWRKERALFGSVANSASISHATAAYRRYPLYMTPYTLVGLTRERLAYFLLGRLGTPQMVGYYGLVARIVNLPNSFIASAVRPVFFQHAAGRDPRSLEEPMLRMIRTLGLVSVLCWLPCMVQAEWLFGFVFGAAWIPAAPYAVVLSFPAIPLLMGNWADRMFDVLGRQRTALITEMSFSILAMAGLLVGYAVFRDLLLAVMVQSALLTLYYFSWLWLLFRIAGFRTTRLLLVIGEVVLLGLVTWAACLGASRLLQPPAALLATLSLCGGLAGWLGWRNWQQFAHQTTATVNGRRQPRS